MPLAILPLHFPGLTRIGSRSQRFFHTHAHHAQSGLSILSSLPAWMGEYDELPCAHPLPRGYPSCQATPSLLRPSATASASARCDPLQRLPLRDETLCDQRGKCRILAACWRLICSHARWVWLPNLKHNERPKLNRLGAQTDTLFRLSFQPWTSQQILDTGHLFITVGSRSQSTVFLLFSYFSLPNSSSLLFFLAI